MPEFNADKAARNALRDLVRHVLAYDNNLNDPHGDNSGEDSRSPDGDDYNELYGYVKLAAEQAGIAWSVEG
jgi:hypothetical protein